jgi:hypothetical protein
MQIQDLPRVDSATCGDFTLTVSTSQSRYRAKELSSNSLFNFEVSIVYNGNKSEVLAWHSKPYYTLNFIDKSGEPLLANGVLDILLSSIFRNGEPHIYKHDGSAEYNYLGSIPKGEYRAVANLELYLDEDGQSQPIKCTAEVPFIVE